MKLDKAREIVYQAGLDLIKEGLVSRTWGNISIRIDDTHFLITPSGRNYETLKPEEIVLVNTDDLSYDGDIKPSSEKGMHAGVYKSRTEIMAVVHTHQLQASTVAAACKEVTNLSDEHSKLLGKSVRCAGYALPGTKKLSLLSVKALEGGRSAALLANHGAICAGKTMQEAFDIAKVLEDACEAFIARSFQLKYGKTGCSIEEMHAHYCNVEI